MEMQIQVANVKTGSEKQLLAFGKRFGHSNDTQTDLTQMQDKQEMTYMQVVNGKMIGLKPF